MGGRKRKDITRLFWALGLEPTHQLTRSKCQTEPDKFKIDKRIKKYNRYYLPKRNKYNSREFFWAKHTDPLHDRVKKHRKKLIELEKECDFPGFSTELLISNL